MSTDVLARFRIPFHLIPGVLYPHQIFFLLGGEERWAPTTASVIVGRIDFCSRQNWYNFICTCWQQNNA